MFRNLRTISAMTIVGVRTLKNFGHKREPIPAVTTLWHGALTFTFMGLVIKWEKVKNFIFGESADEILNEAIKSSDNM